MVDPATIAALLRELAIYYELDADKHRAIAYDRAAKSIDSAQGLERLIAEARLEELPNIGPSIARTIGELAARGTVPVLDQMRQKWPPIVVELALLPKVGVPKARKLYQAFHPPDLGMIAALCREGQVSELPGFGKVSEQKILAAIEERQVRGLQTLLLDAQPHAESLASHLRADPAALRVEVCGAVRRWSEIVECFPFAIATHEPDKLVDRLAAFPLCTSVDRAARTGLLADGSRVELHLAPPDHFGWTMVVATGSPEHVAMLRERAAKRGMDLDKLAADDEPLVYQALGLPWLPPEIRDGTDEVTAALAGDKFTDLITLDDLNVATHCHTTYSDGKASVAEMVRAAAELGFDAITITDHSAAASYAGGLDLSRLREQAAEIAGLVDPEARVFRGTEADINVDGTIDVPPDAGLDVIIASIHQRYKLEDQTDRVITALRQPFFKIWGHALGRMVLRRAPIPVRIDDVLDAAAESRCAIEINGDPHRLDLDPINARKAAQRGIKFVLSSDAHSTGALAYTRFAVAMARRARLRKTDVLNALPVEEFAAAVAPGVQR